MEREREREREGYTHTHTVSREREGEWEPGRERDERDRVCLCVCVCVCDSIKEVWKVALKGEQVFRGQIGSRDLVSERHCKNHHLNHLANI